MTVKERWERDGVFILKKSREKEEECKRSEGGRRGVMYTTGSNRFLGTISEQRRHSRTAICGNRPTGRAVLRSTFNWPTAKLGERLPVSREGLASSISPSSPSSSCCSSSSVHFSPGSCSSYIRLCAERGCREGNNRMERLSVSRLPSDKPTRLYIYI